MSGNDQGFATILNRTEMRFSIFQLGHELFIVAFHVPKIEIAIGPIAVTFRFLFFIEPG